MNVIVVGGGIIGAACASALAHKGVNVQLIDEGVPPGGASVRCDGGLLLMNKRAEAMPYAIAALLEWERLGHTLGQVEYVPNPLLMVATSATQQSLRMRAQAMAELGLDVEELDEAGCYAAEPGLAPGMSYGIRMPGNRAVQPMLATAALLRLARQRGATITDNVRVTSVGAHIVSTSDGRFEADEIVVAAGAWSGELLASAGFDLPVHPRRGHVLVLHRSAAETVAVGAMGSAYADVAHNANPELQIVPLVTKTESGTVLVGASRERVGFDTQLDGDIFRALCQGASSLFPGLQTSPVLRSWVGFRPWTPDGFPYVGRLTEGLSVACGHEGEGITYAPLTGTTIAELLVNAQPVPSRWDPGRPKPAQ